VKISEAERGLGAVGNLHACLLHVTKNRVTGELRDAPLFRIPVNPTEQNGLTKASQVMVEEVLMWWHNGGELITEICHAWYYVKKYS